MNRSWYNWCNIISLVIQYLYILLGHEHNALFGHTSWRKTAWLVWLLAKSEARLVEAYQHRISINEEFFHCLRLRWILCDAHVCTTHRRRQMAHVCVCVCSHAPVSEMNGTCSYTCSGMIARPFIEQQWRVWVSVDDVHNYQQMMPNSPCYAIFISLTCPFRMLYQSSYSPQN